MMKLFNANIIKLTTFSLMTLSAINTATANAQSLTSITSNTIKNKPTVAIISAKPNRPNVEVKHHKIKLPAKPAKPLIPALVNTTK